MHYLEFILDNAEPRLIGTQIIGIVLCVYIFCDKTEECRAPVEAGTSPWLLDTAGSPFRENINLNEQSAVTDPIGAW
jgi:hypothetical protein